MGSCNKDKREVCAKKRKGIPVVEGRKRGGEGVYKRTAEEGIHSAIQVTINSTSVLCRKEGQKEEDSPGL